MSSLTEIDVINSLILEIEKTINITYSNRLKTLPVKINKRNNNITVTWNIYPPDSGELNDLFLSMKKIIDTNLKKIKGEIIKLEAPKGSITDNGVVEFRISKGLSWEVYLYDPEVFIYVRLLYESRLINQSDEWLSIDIDIVEKSAWFLD